ncbi:hypothetical protein RhiirA4_461665 [Rhizophagus irregularis]|uniref:RNase H type-1 domain-containing protein n=1 Tax=Rhizophagus irregularis TaxID=588596 RepID=A0A2I1GJB8_9GLOM|nr:hypothetical protein RhiirA4_461665 [Rhizophagus irregularis]
MSTVNHDKSLQELKEILHTLPNNKAAGQSTIKYEDIKHLHDDVLSYITSFFSKCLELDQNPNAWNNGLLFPILKPKDWNCEINQTRPIVLLETFRKFFVKSLTTRINKFYQQRIQHLQVTFEGESTVHPSTFAQFTVLTDTTLLPEDADISLIRRLLIGGELTINTLIRSLIALRSEKNLAFYTDGTLRSPQFQITIPLPPIPQMTYPHGNTILSPSSTKAECHAILTAILVCPNSSEVQILTDSQNCINTCKSINNPLTSTRKLLKIPNHQIWRIIKHIISTKSISITLYKVKAHSGNLFNDLAVAEASKGLDVPPIAIILQFIPNATMVPLWD